MSLPTAPVPSSPSTPAPRPSAAPLVWHDEAAIHGVRVRAHFVDPAGATPAAPGGRTHTAAAADDAADAIDALLPMLPGSTDGGGPRRPRPVASGAARAWRVGRVAARPHAVLEHGDALLCVSAPRPDPSAPPHRRGDWRASLGLLPILIALADALVVAAESRRVVAALCRLPGVVYQFDPDPPVLECLAAQLAGAAAAASGELDTLTWAASAAPAVASLPGMAATVNRHRPR